ncbi:unnamed protein product, partial [Lymnaea stagnalis]
FVSDETRLFFELFNYVILCSVVAVVGIVSNIINIIVFCRQGLYNTVNISLTALAVSELCSLASLLWFDICVSPLFGSLNVPIVPSEVQHLTGGLVRGFFSRISNWITVFITSERCLCVVAPMTVKKMITPTRTIKALLVMYVITVLPLVPEYLSAYLGWKFVEERNATLFGLTLTRDSPRLEGLTFLIYFIYILIAYVVVSCLTCILILKLKQKTDWRQKSIFGMQRSEVISARDKKTISMIVAVAIVFIVCNGPSVVLYMVGYLLPGFSVVGERENLFFVSWSFGFHFEALNGTIVIMFYYKMSSKYRRSFLGLF